MMYLAQDIWLVYSYSYVVIASASYIVTREAYSER